MAPKRTIAAYAAGLLDGEGCISPSRNADGRRVFRLGSVSIINTYLPVLREMQQIYGGVVRERPRIPTNVTRTPRQCWEWRLERKLDMKRFLQDVLPFLRIKRQRAEHGIALLELQASSNTGRPLPSIQAEKREVLAEVIKVLNQKGESH